ncbi:ATP-binding cassette domain-containing protein, partial [Francisella tularensis subsp. holarctica]|uniref:ATP-binding cassette domain-containing protein n=1 Tax=Francisella tularensis TaxID=263 RepID=UPI002381C29E
PDSPPDKNPPKTLIETPHQSIRENALLALGGQSGAGQSSLVRILSGRLKPTSGRLCDKGAAIVGPVDNIGMGFHTFALLPWV